MYVYHEYGANMDNNPGGCYMQISQEYLEFYLQINVQVIRQETKVSIQTCLVAREKNVLAT